jgi:fatty-acyl-CoA synthase
VGGLLDADPVPVVPIVHADDAVMIQYTSGTTGFPKGALLHHRGLVNNGAHAFDRMGVADGAVWLTTMPLFHTGGCVICVLGAVSKRATQVLVESFDPALVLELIETYRCQALAAVPTMLVGLMEPPRFASTDLSSLQIISSGGSTVPAALVTAFEEQLGARFTMMFGQTECSPVASMTYPTDSVTDKSETIGSPMPNVEVRIVDVMTGETLPLVRWASSVPAGTT